MNNFEKLANYTRNQIPRIRSLDKLDGTQDGSSQCPHPSITTVKHSRSRHTMSHALGSWKIALSRSSTWRIASERTVVGSLASNSWGTGFTLLTGAARTSKRGRACRKDKEHIGSFIENGPSF